MKSYAIQNNNKMKRLIRIENNELNRLNTIQNNKINCTCKHSEKNLSKLGIKKQ